MNNNPNLVAGQACPRMNLSLQTGEKIECKDSGQNDLQAYCRLGTSFSSFDKLMPKLATKTIPWPLVRYYF